MAPTHANKDGRRYRYYVSQPLKEKSADADAVWRLPAPVIEEVVVKEICRTLHDRPRLIEALGLTQTPPTRIKAILSRAANLGNRLREAGPAEQQNLFRELVNQVEVRHESICISLRADALRAMIGVGEAERDHEPKDLPPDTQLTLELPIRFKRRGVEMKLILANEREPTPKPDPILIKAVAEGHGLFDAPPRPRRGVGG